MRLPAVLRPAIATRHDIPLGLAIIDEPAADLAEGLAPERVHFPRRLLPRDNLDFDLLVEAASDLEKVGLIKKVIQ